MGRMFGTDGVRGIANTELTAELAYNLGRAGAYVLTEGTHKPRILVAKDTRISGDMLESALVAGILSVGAEAIILGVVPTPAVAHLTREYNADAGVMISASHNPVEYNGIKFFDGKGYKLSDSLEDEIQRVIECGFKGVPSPVGEGVGRVYREESALNEYIEYAKSTIKTDFKRLKVALDKLGITGMTVTNVLGYGMQKGSTDYYRGVPLDEVTLLPQLKVEIVVCKIPVDTLVKVIKKALYTGKIGDGKIFVQDVENVIKIRTNEEGYDALQDDDEK